MAKGRLISTSFWDDSKVVDDFTPEDKYIYLYCMTNPHTNLCGCYEVSVKQIASETGYNEDTVKRLLMRLDREHNVIRYSSTTKEMLMLNWFRYNWSTSEKLNKPLLAEIRAIKDDGFREYLAGRYDERDTVTVPYEYYEDVPPQDTPAPAAAPESQPRRRRAAPPEQKVRHKRGEYGWVKLTDEEFERLRHELGDVELQRCIAYIDESAQATGNKNKWKDWNLVIRKCSRDGWGLSRRQAPRSSTEGAMGDLQEIHRMFDGEGGP